MSLEVRGILRCKCLKIIRASVAGFCSKTLSTYVLRILWLSELCKAESLTMLSICTSGWIVQQSCLKSFKYNNC